MKASDVQSSHTKALIVYAHPSPGSFNAAVLQTVISQLQQAGAEHRVIDLYSEQFQPCLTREDWTEYEDTKCNTARIANHVEHVRWCNCMIFIYPTWWFGHPAVLKGWLDRVLVPGVAFEMPNEHCPRITHNLHHITRLGVFTTCGASWWLTKMIGSPGKRILMRGLRTCINRKAKATFAAHYLMDSSTQESRERHLAKVARKMRGLLGVSAKAPVRQAQPASLGQTAGPIA